VIVKLDVAAAASMTETVEIASPINIASISSRSESRGTN